ncbi:MAG: hypothetical protein KDJ68_10470 [Rhodobiaceae bacterium]|nr:hypothetical protein [Rhodobiaceae bacterium]MCB1618432.1 hypothetical protein [Pseudomonadales bacterium]
MPEIVVTSMAAQTTGSEHSMTATFVSHLQHPMLAVVNRLDRNAPVDDARFI